MKSFFERDVLALNPRILHTWSKACDIVAQMPHLDPLGREVRCHELARAVHQRLHEGQGTLGTDLEEWVVRDGRFLKVVEHSWLEMSHPPSVFGAAERLILDVYAVGSHPQVQVVYQSSLIHRFEVCSPREDIRHDVVWWLRDGAEKAEAVPVPGVDLTEAQREAARKVLLRIGSWTHARFDQHLRDEISDEDADAILRAFESLGVLPKECDPSGRIRKEGAIGDIGRGPNPLQRLANERL